MISGHFEPETYAAVHLLLLEMSAKEGERITLRELIGRGLAAIFSEQGKTPPAELRRASRPKILHMTGRPRRKTPDG